LRDREGWQPYVADLIVSCKPDSFLLPVPRRFDAQECLAGRRDVFDRDEVDAVRIAAIHPKEVDLT
jgi:hypothetical protein